MADAAPAARRPADVEHRNRALTEKDRTFLVEAGAGSGKTSIMAGRAALLVANGENPAGIVAITFTEAAAAELRQRIEKFLRLLAVGQAPVDLQPVFPEGVPEQIVKGAQEGLKQFDHLVATTIHGFCQILLRPYPLEAGMDPGAVIVDPEVGEMAFQDSVEGWMRDLLNGEAQIFVTSLFEHAATEAAECIRMVTQAMRKTRTLHAPEVEWDAAHFDGLKAAIQRFIELYPVDGDIPNGLKERTTSFLALLATCNGAPADRAACIAWALVAALPKEIRTRKGELYAKACNKADWQALGKTRGWNKVDVDARFDGMGRAWEGVREAWANLKSHAVAVAARLLTDDAQEALQRYVDWKRAAALLDFDDLLVKARDLLASNDQIRRKLGEKYPRILVDEFQDTDPIQAEIIWRLCGDPGDNPDDWKSYRIRPGALFVVGDPKQAIYRFRGADVFAYLDAKKLVSTGEPAPGEVLPITVNFRSTTKILDHVNRVYEPVLNGNLQPGFTALSAFREYDGPLVQALDVHVPEDILNARGDPSADGLRAAEAAAVADFLVRVVGSFELPDGKGGFRPAKSGDIALLAPTGTSFWIYEAALERADISLAPQAGKGFLTRQEVLDLTALARAISDPRDTLALGTFLRGPVLGFTDEEILDALAALPGPGRRRLSMNMDPTALPLGRFRGELEKLQALRRLARRTTPYQALSAAVEAFAIRAVLAVRHPRSIERSTANLSAFLNLSRAWDTRGLKAFADEMRRRHDENTRQAEGRPDQGADAVSIVTMHSAKGLEWPIVMAVNMGTGIRDQPAPVKGDSGLLFSLLGEPMPGYKAANDAEKEERARERARLLYVADTRARDLLVVSRLSREGKAPSWNKVCPGRLEGLPAIDLSAYAPELPEREELQSCPQDEAAYTADAGRVAAAHRQLNRITPSRHEDGHAPTVGLEVIAIEEEPIVEVTIKGGPKRGLILHKLLEEILNGEIQEAEAEPRAAVLIQQLQAETVEAHEIRETIVRTLSLPEIAAVRDRLVPEADIAFLSANGEDLIVGIADAIAVREDSTVELVIDWKSDVAPAPQTLNAYRGQMADYLRSVGCDRGLIVLMTQGCVLEVLPA